ncbi:MAG: hypothetical protein V4683_15495 [Bacteroidota bacterium]
MMETPNNILKTFRQHTYLSIGIIVFSSCITVLVVSNNMKQYKNACQSTFIYYKNGSSVLVNTFEKANKK